MNAWKIQEVGFAGLNIIYFYNINLYNYRKRILLMGKILILVA
jgi:hypothetical protein